jgi:hypothetical protein
MQVQVKIRPTSIAVSNMSDRKGWPDAWAAIFVAILTACTAALPLVGNRYFYFADDFQMMFMPAFLEIAHQIKEWQIPLVTNRTWLGGAFAAEYQFALANPVSIALYLLMDRLDRLDQAAAVFALFHLALLSAGIFTLCRGLGIARAGAATAALAGSTSMWVIYWGQTWVNALVGITWLPWALFSLLLAYRRTRYIGLAAITTAVALASGWPYTVVALLVIIGIGTVISFALNGRFGPCIRVIISVGLAGAIAAPAFLPLWFYLEESTRVHGELTNVFVTYLGTLVAVSLPIFPEVWRVFSNVDSTSVSPPIHYVSWFVLPVLANANWTILKERQGSLGLGLILVAVAFGFLSMYAAGWHFRWPFRLLPYYHITLAILSGWLMTRAVHDGREPSVWKTGRTALVFAVPLGIGFFNLPAVNADQIALFLWICVLVLLCQHFQRSWPRYWMVVPAVGHITIFMYLTAIFPHNDFVPKWEPLVERPASQGIMDAPKVRQLSLFQYQGIDDSFGTGKAVGEAFWLELMPGNTPLYHDVEAINGYSAVEPRGFRKTFCLDFRGASCLDVAKQLFSVDRDTGLSLLDLTRVDRVVAQRGLHAERFASEAGQAWVLAKSGEYSDVFVRREVLPVRPGSVSVLPAGMQMRVIERRPSRESYHVQEGHGGGRIIWARAWYPGYRASLSGRRLEVEPVLGLLPSIALPPGAEGELVLEYIPEGLELGLVIASVALGLAIALSIGCLVLNRKGRERASESVGG